MLDPDTSRIITRLREPLLPIAWRITLDPHITIVPPSRATMPPAQAIVSFLKLSLELPPSISSAERIIRLGSRRSQTLALAVQPRPWWQRLHRLVATSALWQVALPSREFLPHITVLNHVDPTVAATAENYLSQADLPIIFPAQSVSLLMKQPAWPTWHELARVAVGSASNIGRH